MTEERLTQTIIGAVILMVVVGILVGIGVSLHNDEVRAAKWRALAEELSPRIRHAYKEASTSKPSTNTCLARRPYVIVHMGADLRSRFNDLKSVGGIINMYTFPEPPPIHAIGTIILVKDTYLESATYRESSVSRKTGDTTWSERNEYLRFRYSLWAVDVSGEHPRVNASTTLEDGEFEETGLPSQIDQEDIRVWADSVTGDGTAAPRKHSGNLVHTAAPNQWVIPSAGEKE